MEKCAFTSMSAEAQSHRLPADKGFITLFDTTGKPVPHVVPQSEKTFSEPIKLEHQDEVRRIPTTYILTVDPGKKPEEDAFFRYYERAKARGWKTEVMVGTHVVHITNPVETAHLLEAAP